MALIGAVLTNHRCFHKVAGFLRADDFADKRHARIFAAIAKCIGAGETADAVTLKNHFEATGELEELGGPSYLARLSASVVSIINAEDYGRAVWDNAMRRDLIGVGEDLIADAYNRTIDASATKILSKHLGQIHKIGRASGERPAITIFEAAANSLLETEKAMKGERRVVRTGMAKVDAMTGGFEPQDLVIVAGRPSMGKSAIVGNWLINQTASNIR